MQDGLALLEWYKAMGVDEAISETPTDWSAMTGFALPREAMPRNASQPAVAQPGIGDPARANPSQQLQNFYRGFRRSATEVIEK